MKFVNKCYFLFFGFIIFLLLLPIPLYFGIKKISDLNIWFNLLILLYFVFLINYLLLYKIKYSTKKYDYIPNTDLIGKGTWVDLYKSTHKDRIIKVWHPPHSDKVTLGNDRPDDCFENCGRGWGLFSNLGIAFPEKKKCNGFQYLFWLFCMAGQWESVLNKYKLSDKTDFVAKVYCVNEDKLFWEEELCEKRMNLENCLVNYEEEIKKFNDLLKEHKLYVMDLHFFNLMLKDNKVKLIDGEIVNKFMKNLCIIGYNLIRGFSMKPVKDLDRIYWSNEPERIPVDICYNKNYNNKNINDSKKYYNTTIIEKFKANLK